MSGGRYLDLQVNGYGGVDFNTDGLTAEGLRRACEAMRRDGVAGVLATVITDSLEAMTGRLRRLVELREADELARELIVGLHVEGPFLSERDAPNKAHLLGSAMSMAQAEQNLRERLGLSDRDVDRLVRDNAAAVLSPVRSSRD